MKQTNLPQFEPVTATLDALVAEGERLVQEQVGLARVARLRQGMPAEHGCWTCGIGLRRVLTPWHACQGGRVAGG